jgi:hypothetical protein
VGKAIASSGLSRQDVLVTTKLWNADHGCDETLTAFDRSLAALGMDTVDLYLIHWPVPARDRYVATPIGSDPISRSSTSRSARSRWRSSAGCPAAGSDLTRTPSSSPKATQGGERSLLNGFWTATVAKRSR